MSFFEHSNQPEKPSSELGKQLHEFLIAHLHEGPTLSDLANFLGYSEKYCSELFHTNMGQPFSQYLKQLRLDRANKLLLNSPAPIAQIAELVGFRDQFAFSHFFKKAMGCSPRDYRGNQRNQNSGSQRISSKTSAQLQGSATPKGSSPLRFVSSGTF